MSRYFFLASLILWSLSPWPSVSRARAAVYRWVDRQGVAHFTDAPTESYFHSLRKPAGHRSRPAAASPVPATRSYHDIDGLIRKIAREDGVDPALVRAVIRVESNYNPRAVSRKGAQGLMQLMPGTADRFGVPNPFNAEENIRGGVKYLKYLLNRFGGNLRLALAAYNAGENSVDRHGGVPPYRETTSYVEKVFHHYTASDFPASTRIYRVVNKDGSVLFTNIPR